MPGFPEFERYERGNHQDDCLESEHVAAFDLESHQLSYIEELERRSAAIAELIHGVPVDIAGAEERIYAYFRSYISALMNVPQHSIDLPYQLSHALCSADASQAELNMQQYGRPFKFDIDSTMPKILAIILSAKDSSDAQQMIGDLYVFHMQAPVLRHAKV